MTKFLKGLVCGVCAAVIFVGGLCAIGYSSRDSRTGKWFSDSHLSWNKDGNSVEIDNKVETNSWGGVVDGDGNKMNEVATYAMPASMAFYAAAPVAETVEQSNPAVTITASHNFEYNNIAVDWSAEYPSGVSASDVLTVTPTSDGSLTASVSCSAPFSTQITLKVTSRDNPEVFATTTVDYIRRIDSVANLGKLFKAQEGKELNSSDATKLDADINFGVGTIYGDISVKSVRLYWDSNAVKCYSALLVNNMRDKYHLKDYVLGNISLVSDDNVHFASESTVIDWSVSNLVNGYVNASSSEKQAIDYALYNGYKNFGSKVNIYSEYVLEVKYNGSVIQEYSRSAFTFVKWTGAKGAEELKPDLTFNTNVAL